jgi:hypothetical protein
VDAKSFRNLANVSKLVKALDNLGGELEQMRRP